VYSVLLLEVVAWKLAEDGTVLVKGPALRAVHALLWRISRFGGQRAQKMAH